MPPDRLRVTLAVWELLNSSGGSIALDVHSLSTALHTSRSTIIRTLEDLERAGFVHTLSTAGRTGGTTVQQARPDWFAERFPAANPPNTTLQNSNEKKPASLPAEQLTDSIPEQFNQPVLDLLSPTQNSDPNSDSPGRSSTLEIQRNETLADPAKNMTPPEPQQSTGAPAARKRATIDPTRIPHHAWNAADGLRRRILMYQPGNRLATRPWGGQSGDRLKWAHTFDLMARVDRRGWLDISAVMRWLWPDDASKGPTPAARMFVIESADSLREKFDRVVAAQRREHTEATARAPADNRAAPAFKSWGNE